MSAADVARMIFSLPFAAGVLRVTTPILLPALGGLLCAAAGKVNIALEGLMLAGAFAGVLVSAQTGSAWLGLLAALAAGGLLALGLAVAHLRLGADLILAGFALNLLASGGTVFLLRALTGTRGSSSQLASQALPALDLGRWQGLPLLGPLLHGQNVMVPLAFVLALAVGLLLERTVFGLRLRAAGGSPAAAASAGLDVRRLRYAALILSGLLAGLGGAHLGMGYLQLFQQDMTAGRGFIALAAVALGGGRAGGVLAAALAFGAADALSIQLGLLAIPPQLIQALPYAATLAALAAQGLMRRRAAGRREEER